MLLPLLWKTLIPSIFRPLICPPVTILESTGLNMSAMVMHCLPHWVPWPIIAWYFSGHITHPHTLGVNFSLRSIKHHDTTKYWNIDTWLRWMDYLHTITYLFRGKEPAFPDTKRIAGQRHSKESSFSLSVDRTQIYGSPNQRLVI